VKELYSLL